MSEWKTVTRKMIGELERAYQRDLKKDKERLYGKGKDYHVFSKIKR